MPLNYQLFDSYFNSNDIFVDDRLQRKQQRKQLQQLKRRRKKKKARITIAMLVASTKKITQPNPPNLPLNPNPNLLVYYQAVVKHRQM